MKANISVGVKTAENSTSEVQNIPPLIFEYVKKKKKTLDLFQQIFIVYQSYF